MSNLRLYKREKLRSLSAVDALFGHSRIPCATQRVMAWPWRATWRVNEARVGSSAQFLITVPKRRLKHAVDRVRMRRLCREAYRLNRHLLPPDSGADIAFIYVGDRLTDYATTTRSVTRILSAIHRSLSNEE